MAVHTLLEPILLQADSLPFRKALGLEGAVRDREVPSRIAVEPEEVPNSCFEEVEGCWRIAAREWIGWPEQWGFVVDGSMTWQCPRRRSGC